MKILEQSISIVFSEGLKPSLARLDFKGEEWKAIWAYALYIGSSKLTNVLIQMKEFILRLKNYKFEDLLIYHCECLEEAGSLI